MPVDERPGPRPEPETDEEPTDFYRMTEELRGTLGLDGDGGATEEVPHPARPAALPSGGVRGLARGRELGRGAEAMRPAASSSSSFLERQRALLRAEEAQAPPPQVERLSLPAEARRLASLAWPMVLGQLGFTAMGVEDTVMVGHFGPTDLAGVALGHMWSYSILVVGVGALHGLDPVFAQAHGAGDRARSVETLGRAAVLSLLMSVPIIILHFAAGPALRLMSQPDSIVPMAAGYAQAIAWGAPPMLLFMALTNFLQAIGQGQLPLWTVVFGNVANVVLNAIFIYDLAGNNLNGAVGCGAATVFARWAMVAALFLQARPIIENYLAELPGPPSAVRDMPRMLTVGMPVGFQYGLEMWAFSAAGMMMGQIGAAAVAAHSITVNMTSVLYMIPAGIASAAAVRIGNLIGARAGWKRSAWVAIGLGAASTGVLSIGLWLGGDLVGRAYTNDAGVLDVILIILPLAAAFQLFDATQCVTIGVLRGAGDTRFPALVNLVGYWFVGLPMGAYLGLGERFHLGAAGIWAGLLIALGTVAVAVVLRLLWIMRRGVTLVEP
jgi:MATE family multidrug resistance protein